MTKKPIVSKHVLADKAPLVIAAVLMIVLQYAPNVIGSELVERLLAVFPIDNMMLAFVITSLALSILFQLIFERWFYPEYEGSLGLKGLGRGLMVALPVIAVAIAIRSLSVLLGFQTFYPPTFTTLMMAARAGINEEAAFRGIALALLHRRYRGRNDIWVPAVFTGVFFGCTHLMNLFSGDELVNTLVNVVFACGMGVLIGTLFTLSGNVWPCYVMHTIYDLLAFCCEETEVSSDWFVLAEVAVFIVLMAIYLVYLFKKRDETAALWNSKWKNPLPEQR